MRGGGIGADGDDGLLRLLRGGAQRGREILRVAEDGRYAVDGVLAARVDRDVQHLRLVVRLLGRGLGQVDLQLGVLAVRRREEQEDQDDDQDVDQRDQVDVRLFPPVTAAELHARRSPWISSTSLTAWLSISTTRTST